MSDRLYNNNIVGHILSTEDVDKKNKQLTCSRESMSVQIK